MISHQRLAGYVRLAARVLAMTYLLCPPLLIQGTAASADETVMALRKTRHHHCVHEEKSQRFDDSVDRDSLMTPQLVLPLESPSQHELNAFLEAVGAKRRLRSSSSERSLAASASSTAFQPIRIAFDVSKLTSDTGSACTREGEVVQVDESAYTCTSGDVLTADKREFIITVLLKAIKDYFESTLSVQRVVGNLVIKGIGCSTTDDWACCANSIPPSYKTEGVADADFVLHVTGRPTTGSTIAWALPCNLDQFGRPVSGQANFGPGLIDPVTVAARTEQIGTALHEMTHALVFSRGRFSDFRQPLNGPKWGYNNVVSQSQGPGGIWVSKIVTPSVAKQAKVQFNCFDWVNAGIELENGDSGSADFSSHWEKRILMNEYMTATSSYDPVYSAMTLALFEDSGWYQVSFKNAQVLPWGYMEGCGVAQGRCSTWNSRYICSEAAQTGCTADYSSKGYCNVASYTSSIPAGFQYFDDQKFGGRDTYADYCPFYRAYSNGDCRNIGRTPTNVNSDNYMEQVGPNSKCFQSSLSKSGSDTAALRSSCYKVLGCTSKGLRLSIGSGEVLCPMEGGALRVSGYKGSIMCPVANRLCQMMQDKCSGNGVLSSSGDCECNPGFVGDDCSGIACPVSAATNAECGSAAQGKCDYTTGKCACTSAYTGITCSELVCPSSSGGKNTSECSGHGACDRVNGVCKCGDGYSGKACECVPGCTATSCGANGACDCLTGACSCVAGYSGVSCLIPSNAPTVELTEQGDTVNTTVSTKEYKFYKINLRSSTYDVTFSVQYANNGSKGVDVDLYGSFVDKYPTSLTAKTVLFVSDYAIGNRDEINLCGSLGVFPRGLNNTFRYCPRPTSAYVTETPGVFYLSVLGYTGGAYSLSVVADKCRNVTCSYHGACGVNIPGVCTCDRYWTGDDCSIPKCGPDCQDLGTCKVSQSGLSAGRDLEESEPGTDVVHVNYATTTTTGLQTISECYGNGVCRVTQNATGQDVPRCLCDDAFTFTNPTPAQALCKELLPSVASVQRYTDPFTFLAMKADQALKISAWALFTIRVKDDWQVLVANLAIQTPETDAMLFVRKEKLPSVAVTSTSGTPANGTTSAASSSSFLQFMDADGWTSGSSRRKVVLTRATSTLSSGLYYIGVLNSAYARAPLLYTLTVNATSNCTSTLTAADSGFGICVNEGRCNAQSSQICSCRTGFVGKYCDLRAVRAVLSPSSSMAVANTPVNSTAAPTSASYVAYQSREQQQLPIGEWAYYSFDVNDSSVQLVQFRLRIDNALTGETPVMPLLLVRGPRDDGFPTLFRESQQDFQAVAQRSTVQSVTLAVDTMCAFAATSKDCYKVAVFNRNYSGEALRYRLEVELFPSRTAVFPSASCGATSSKVNCNDNGKCIMVADATATTSPSSVPTCQCNAGWTGLRCNSPKAFDMPQLWSAINNISLLCSTCNTTFSLGRGEVKMFRVPSSMRANAGLLLRVVAATPSTTTKSMNASTTRTLPNVYVSETLPRSLYDFTHISNANDSAAAVRLTNESLTGLFWVVVFTDYPASGASDLSLSSSLLSRRRQRRLGADADVTEATGAASFQLQVEVFALGSGDDGALITDKSFGRAVADWLFKSRVGVAVLATSVVFLVLVVCFCLWRVCNAPENQDKATSRFFGGSQARYPANGVSLGRVGGAAHVMDVERGTPQSTSRS